MSLCLDFYIKFNPLLDDNNIPNGLSSIKIFDMKDIDDLIVITGDGFFLWPFCFMFTYKDKKLSLFPDSAPFEDDGAEEIRLLYDEGFPYPIVEIFSYSHLIPTYEDVNNDGYIDIIITGKFQCEDGDYNVLLSQEVKRTFLFDKKRNTFIFNMDASIRSPLEEYWSPYVTQRMEKWIGQMDTKETHDLNKDIKNSE